VHGERVHREWRGVFQQRGVLQWFLHERRLRGLVDRACRTVWWGDRYFRMVANERLSLSANSAVPITAVCVTVAA
jgi:hypothetical protein